MGLFRKIAGLFGVGKDHDKDEDKEEDDRNREGANFQPTALPRKGFSIPVDPSPLLVPSNSGDGGVQGLQWYAKRLRIDEDGDVAHEFLDEVLPKASSGIEEDKRHFPRFKVRRSAQSVKVKEQVIALDGRIQHCVEHKGRVQWV